MLSWNQDVTRGLHDLLNQQQHNYDPVALFQEIEAQARCLSRTHFLRDLIAKDPYEIGIGAKHDNASEGARLAALIQVINFDQYSGYRSARTDGTIHWTTNEKREVKSKRQKLANLKKSIKGNKSRLHDGARLRYEYAREQSIIPLQTLVQSDKAEQEEIVENDENNEQDEKDEKDEQEQGDDVMDETESLEGAEEELDDSSSVSMIPVTTIRFSVSFSHECGAQHRLLTLNLQFPGEFPPDDDEKKLLLRVQEIRTIQAALTKDSMSPEEISNLIPQEAIDECKEFMQTNPMAELFDMKFDFNEEVLEALGGEIQPDLDGIGFIYLILLLSVAFTEQEWGVEGWILDEMFGGDDEMEECDEDDHDGEDNDR